MKIFRPLIFIASLILAVSLACSVNLTDEPTAVPQQPVDTTAQPAQPIQPQQDVPATEEAQPIQPVSPSSGPFFTEEFDSDPQWYYEVIKGTDSSDAEKATYKFESGRMIFDIPDPELYAYYMFKGDTYENVRLDIKVENRGVNSQQVSLVCRESDEGWYELSIQSDGTWILWAVQNGYNLVTNGGSTAIKQGKEVNEYTMICDDNQISFFFNGVEHKSSPFTERKFALKRGNVGFSISSLRAVPVKVEVDWFKISEP